MKTKKGIVSILSTVLAFVGTVSIVTPNCIGWFYKPKLPDALKK